MLKRSAWNMLMLLGFAVFITAPVQPSGLEAQSSHVLVKSEELNWRSLPPEWADGPPPAGFAYGSTEVAIVQGDPTKQGVPFVIRLRSTPGTPLPPHWHTTDENVTVLSGTWCVGMGDKFDDRACQDMPAGSFIFIPKGMRHFAVAKGDIVQIHGIGPFQVHWVK